MPNEIACIVLNYNNYSDTEKCVDNIINNKCKVDVVIPDNNSINESYDYLFRKYEFKDNVYVIKNSSNTGYSAGNNFGIKYIIEKNPSIKYICVMNPDTSFDNPNLLEKMKNILYKEDDLAVIAPTMHMNGEKDFKHTCWLLPGNIDFLKRLFSNYKWKSKNYLYKKDNMAYTEVLHGSFFMIKREVLEKIDFLDENIFLYSEENLLGFKVKDLGMREAVCLDEIFYHNHSTRKERRKYKEKIKILKINANSRLYICKLYYPKYLYPIACLTTKTNLLIVSIKHIVGNIFKGSK